MLRTKLIPAVLLLVVLSVFAVAVLATGGTPGGDGDDQVKEDVVQAILDDDGNVIDHNRRLAQVSSDHEGGFGGWYFSDDKNTVYVFMKDTSKTEQARSAVEASYLGRHAPTNVVVVSGAHSLTELSTWLYQLVDGLVTEGINFKSVAIDHSQNRIDLGVAEDSHIDIAKRVMKDLQIPENAIDITVDDSQLLGGGDLEEEWRPVAGAIQHQQIFDGVKCTIGFVTERNDEEGFILASHCTNETKSIGGNDHAQVSLANWYWKGVRQFVWERFGTSLSRSSCLNWLHRLGFAFKRPKKRLLKADQDGSHSWRSTPPCEAQRTEARIFFADEAHFRADAEQVGAEG